MTEIKMDALETVTGGTKPMVAGTRPARYTNGNGLAVDILKGKSAIVSWFGSKFQLHSTAKGSPSY